MHRCVAAVTAALVLTSFTAFSRANAPLARAVAADAAVRVVRFSAADAAVTVQFAGYAGGGRSMSVPAGTAPIAGGYAVLAPGPYVVTVRSALPVSALLTLRVSPGAAYTVGVLIHAGTVHALLVHDDLTAPPAGSGRVRLVLAAAGVPRADVAFASGPVLAGAAPYGTVTGYHTVRAGTRRVTVASATRAGKVSRPLGGPRMVADVAVRSGSLTTLVVVDAPAGGLAVRSIVDAVGAGRTPGGPVPAGGGGMAAAPDGERRGPSATVMGALELLGVFIVWAGLHALVAARRHRVTRRGSAW
jgi:hypothetical protein